MTSKYQENRKIFHRGHYEVIAARFREALTPYVEIETYEEPGSEAAMKEIVAKSAAKFALTNLALELARRFQFDNEDFLPEVFLNRCSPDPDLHPLSELWP